MQFATFMITNIVFTLTLWLWNRSESSNDRRELRSVIDAIQTEMKDFTENFVNYKQEIGNKLWSKTHKH